MTPTRPQQTEEKNSVPWSIEFTRKDLLVAAWGSKKGADLLYHFLHRASWEKKNKRENETLKDVMFQESTPKALEKSGCSLGTFNTFLKHFVTVGYVSSKPYSGEYTVHFETILQAFTNPPEKPIKEGTEPRQPRQKSFNLKDYNFVTMMVEDYQMLMELKDECFKLKELFQSCFNFGPELKELFQSLKQNPSIDAASQADREALSDPLDMLLDNDSMLLDNERENGFAIATPAPLSANIVNYFSGTTSETQGEPNGSNHISSGNNCGNADSVALRNSPRPTGDTHRAEATQSQEPASGQQAVTPTVSYSPEKSTATIPSGASEVSTSTSSPANPVAAPQPAVVQGGRGYTKSVSNTQKVSGAAASTKPEKPARPTRARARSSEPTEYKVYFTVEGALFRSWYEAASGRQLDETYAIARACNSLGTRASVTEEHVKMVVDQINADEMVNKKGIGVTVQDLAGESKWLCWDKWLQGALVAQRNKKPTKAPSSPTEENPYSISSQLRRQAEREAREAQQQQQEFAFV